LRRLRLFGGDSGSCFFIGHGRNSQLKPIATPDAAEKLSGNSSGRDYISPIAGFTIPRAKDLDA
jgi:hypothetical protein